MKARWCIPLVVVGIILALTWAAGRAPLPPGSEAEQMFTAGVTPDFPGFSQPLPTDRSPRVFLLTSLQSQMLDAGHRLGPAGA